MFGGQDDEASAPQGGDTGGVSDDTLNGVADLVGGTATPVGGTPPADTPSAPASDPGFMPTPSEPAQSSVPEPHEEAEDVAAAVDSPAPSTPEPLAEPASDASGDLMDLKQQALQQLSPLVGHLDQTPEEKFRTTMMLIQASDNQDLLKDAYEAAQAITDEKTKAQALLDVINEINYFTQQKPQS